MSGFKWVWEKMQVTTGKPRKPREIKAAVAKNKLIKKKEKKRSSGLLLRWCHRQLKKFFKQKSSNLKEL